MPAPRSIDGMAGHEAKNVMHNTGRDYARRVRMRRREPANIDRRLFRACPVRVHRPVGEIRHAGTPSGFDFCSRRFSGVDTAAVSARASRFLLILNTKPFRVGAARGRRVCSRLHVLDLHAGTMASVTAAGDRLRG
jgi:hypothetical protein